MVLAWVAVAASTVLAAYQGPSQEDKKVLANAAEVLQSLTAAPDKGIPEELLQRAECVLVFPNVVKGAFIVGGRYGRGVATCRDESDTLGSPAFFSIGGASIGWQWGGQSTDFVLLVMNENGMKNLLEDKLTIGADAAAAVGPVGRNAAAATDAQLSAQILSWSRSKGLFAGASLEGAVVKPSEDANGRLYGPVDAAAILEGRDHVDPPAAAREFLDLARSLTARAEDTASNE
jgi:lipid-binding SYLF domain-containing protein